MVMATQDALCIIDDICALRTLTPDADGQKAVLLDTTAVQYLSTNGGWNEETHSSAPAAHSAYLTYYQRSRHIFATEDDNLRSTGKLGRDHPPGQQTPGLNRATCPMALKSALVPPHYGPPSAQPLDRVLLPGVYTVKRHQSDRSPPN